LEITNEQKEKFGLYDTIEEMYQFITSNPQDQKGKNSIQWIAHYMPVLYEYALRCDSVVEIGLNQVCSTWAFLNANPTNGVTSVDIDLERRAYMARHSLHQNIWLAHAKELTKKENVSYTAIESDSLQIDLPIHDLLFIDSLHEYIHLKRELTLHGHKAQKYIILHDTTNFPDLNQAIGEFLDDNKEFIVDQILKDVPGLTILKNTNAKK
jgi:hypothetical protein